MPNQSDPNQNQQTLNNPQGIITPPTGNDPQVIVPDFQTTEIPSIPTEVAATAPKPPDAPVVPSPVETPPPMVPSTPRKKFGGGKIIATILGFLILAGGIVGGVILTQQQQDIRERAGYDEGGITGQTSNTAGGPGNSGGEQNEEEEEETSSGGSSGGQTGSAGGHPGTCIDVDCAITLDQNGTYHYDPAMDHNPNENIDNSGVPDDEFYNELVASTQDNDCTGDGICSSGSCVNNACVASSISCKEGDPGAPGCCANLNEADCEDVVCESGPTGPRKECRIGGPGGQHCTLAVGAAAADCGGANAGEPPDTPSTTPPTSSAQCLDVKAYDSTWALLTLTQLSDLKPTNLVNFCVVGSASSGSFDQAEFKVGSAAKTNVTTPSARPGSTNEYCQSYTIAPTDTTVSVKARIHHPTLGWFGQSI